MSARARIIGLMLLVVTVTLAGSVLVTARVLSARADGLADAELSHEAQKFRVFAASSTGQGYRRVDGLLSRYLQTNLPEASEAFFTVVDGRPQVRSGEPSVRLDADLSFVGQVAAQRTPSYGWVDSRAGAVRYAVLPVEVTGDSRPGSLVVLEFRDQLARPLQESVRIFAYVAAAALLLAGAASWLLAGRVLAPIRLVRQTAEQISESDLRRRIPVTGRDDVARLAVTFNKMLDRLEHAFATQREFLDDAGHELRTPITVIRGHLELMGEAPADRRETVALVLDELGRMNRIVDDLLVLATTERPDFLDRGEVNLADLTVDALAHARMLGSRQWTLEAVAEATVVADGQRLTQALMQLASNAVQHTRDGDGISIGSRVSDGRLWLWVSDTGEGVHPADASHIFDRFHRGERARGSAGAGLGLAIVRSIARAHGGEVELSSRPGAGATFTLDLPAEAVADRPDQQEAANTVVVVPDGADHRAGEASR